MEVLPLSTDIWRPAFCFLFDFRDRKEVDNKQEALSKVEVGGRVLDGCLLLIF